MRIFYFLFIAITFANCQSSKTYEYLAYEPKGYDATEAVPLMIFLHGAGERGDSIDLVKVHGPVKKIEAGEEFPCLVIAPQCPKDVWWQVPRLDAMFAKIRSEYNIDTSKIYLTGLSMGGYGTWAWSIEHPDRFAAIAPICGGGKPGKAVAIATIPTWVFHGAKDQVVPLSQSQEMVDAVKAAGGSPIFTIYPEANHDSWTESYDNPKFYEWLFSHSN